MNTQDKCKLYVNSVALYIYIKDIDYYKKCNSVKGQRTGQLCGLPVELLAACRSYTPTTVKCHGKYTL